MKFLFKSLNKKNSQKFVAMPNYLTEFESRAQDILA